MPLINRYDQLRTDPRASRILRDRAAILTAMREGLRSEGFIEIDTPLLHPMSGPPDGRPFRVETHALPQVFLRGSPLYLRGLLTAGFERVFEIGRSFRDELDPFHSPEYTLTEIYQTQADYTHMRTLAQRLILATATAANQTTTVTPAAGQSVDLDGVWEILDFHHALSGAVGHPIGPGIDRDTAITLTKGHNVRVDDTATADQILLELYDQLVEPNTTAATFYTDFPVSQSPLAEPCPHDERLAQKWDLVIGGHEIATAYTERTHLDHLHDHSDELTSSAEADTLDEDWIAVFAGGMPPAGGLCIGIDRLVLTLTGASALHETIAFPHTATP